MLQLVPFFIIKRRLRRGVSAIAETMRPEEETFWDDYPQEVYGSRTRREQIAMMGMLIDFATHYRFLPGDLDDWPGKIMILDSDSDVSIPASERGCVRALYPQAELHTFEDLGHLAILSERETYLRLISAFLSE